MATVELNQCVACKRTRKDDELEQRHVPGNVLTLCIDPVDCRRNWPPE